MSNLPMKAKLHNRFDIHVEHDDGSIDKYVQYNIVLNNLYESFFRRNTPSGSWINNIVYGTGTGEVDASRTTLFSPLGYKSATLLYRKLNPDNRSGEIQLTITIAPNEHVGANFTEIGIGTSSSAYTHSLIKDAFGNPVAINKTSTDKITIYATVYAEFYALDDTKVGWLDDNGLLRYLLGQSLYHGSGLNYSIYPCSIEPVCGHWINVSMVKFSTGATLTEEGYIKQTLSLGINDFNNKDIRSVVIGTHHMSYGDKHNLGCAIGIDGPNFDGVTYQNQRVGTGNGIDTVFKIPTEYRGVKDCVVKVDNKVVEVKKNIIYGNNKIIGDTNLPYELVKIKDNQFVSIHSEYSSSDYYSIILSLYEIDENCNINLKYSKLVGPTVYGKTSSYLDYGIFPNLNMVAIKNGSNYDLYEVEWKTGEYTKVGTIPVGTNSSTTSARIYAIDGTNYITNTYDRGLYEYSNGLIEKVKTTSKTSNNFVGPEIQGRTLKGDYYDGTRLYKFDASTLEFITTMTLPVSGVVISPFTIATTQEYPGDDNSQQLVIKKCNASWEVDETITFSDKFPKTSGKSYSITYLKDNVFMIGATTEPHIVTFNPDTNRIDYRKTINVATVSGFNYNSIMDIPNSDDFIFPYGGVMICTEKEVGSIEFSTPVQEDAVITMDFNLDYIPKNDSVTASFTTKLQWG